MFRLPECHWMSFQFYASEINVKSVEGLWQKTIMERGDRERCVEIQVSSSIYL